jgi:ABC-type taurine transport system substrate-binding protein
MFRKVVAVVALSLFSLAASAADLWVTEFANPSPILYQAAQGPPTASQKIAISGASTQSAAFSATTRLIRVQASGICSVQVGGTSPTATTTSLRMTEGQTEYFIVAPGDKIAVITNT